MNNTGTWFAGYTLVDITDTGVYRSNGELLLRNQQRNWETVLQTISLTAQPLDITPASGSTKVSLSEHQFGSIFKGLQNCWKFMFYIEQQDAFGADPIATIESNFDQIPIIGGLTESVKFETPLFQTRGEFKNIYFEVYSNLD